MSSAAPNPKGARRLATVLAGTAFLMEALGLSLLFSSMALPSFVPLDFYGTSGYVLPISFTVVGWLIVSRSHANRIGWLLLVLGWFQAVLTLLGQYATYGLTSHPGALPVADVAAWIITWGYIPSLLLFFPTLLLFPDGRLLSRRWRVVLWAVGTAAVLILPAAMVGTWPHRGPDLLVVSQSQTLTSSFQVEAPLLAMLVDFGSFLLLVIAGMTVVGMTIRFRRSSGVERQQLKWVVAAAVLTILLINVAGGVGIPAPFDAVAGVIEGFLLPVAVGIAVLRYRLYEIDVVIRRTLVYVPLTALLAGVYAATIGISQRVFVAAIGQESDGAVILSTLLVAATFSPIRNALQGRVDRSFRDGTNAERRLLAFTETIHDLPAKPDPERTLRAFLKNAVGAVGAGGGEAWLETAAGEESAGATPTRTLGPRVDVPITLDGRRLGRLELDARARGGSFSAGDLAALRLAAERLGLALGARQVVDAGASR